MEHGRETVLVNILLDKYLTRFSGRGDPIATVMDKISSNTSMSNRLLLAAQCCISAWYMASRYFTCNSS